MEKRPPPSLACETWELLFDLLVAARPHLPSAAAACGLTPAQSHALRVLEPGAAVPMRQLAESLGCDASNVTGIVDRLEARGLIRRCPSRQDRRVKELALTPAGAALRIQLVERLAEPLEAVTRLSADEQRALCAILRKALAKGA